LPASCRSMTGDGWAPIAMIGCGAGTATETDRTGPRDVFRAPTSEQDEVSLNLATQFAAAIAWRNGRSITNMRREDVSEVWIRFRDAKNLLNPNIPLVNMQCKRAGGTDFLVAIGPHRPDRWRAKKTALDHGLGGHGRQRESAARVQPLAPVCRSQL
jgi:hypothetical protein